MDINVRAVGNAQVVKLQGGLRLGPPVDAVRSALQELASQGQNRLVLDLSEVPIVDSTGIGLLVRAHTSASKNGGAVKLAAPAKIVGQTLKITGLLQVFEVFSDAEQAAQSFVAGSQAGAA